MQTRRDFLKTAFITFIMIMTASHLTKRFFMGRIDNFQIYDRALSPFEIQQIQHRHFPSLTDGLVGWWEPDVETNE